MEKENGHQDKQNIVEATSKDWNKVMDNCIFLVEIFIKEILSKIKDKDMVSFFGQIAVFIKVSGEVEFKMGKVKFI